MIFHITVSKFAHEHNIDVRVLNANPNIRKYMIQLGHTMVFYIEDIETILMLYKMQGN